MKPVAPVMKIFMGVLLRWWAAALPPSGPFLQAGWSPYQRKEKVACRGEGPRFLALAQNSQPSLMHEAVAAGRICLVEKDTALVQQLRAALEADIALRITHFEQTSAAAKFLDGVGADLVIAGEPADDVPVATFLRGVQQRHAAAVR